MASEFPPFDGSAPKKQQFRSPPELGIDPAKRYTATIDTSLGELVIALDAAEARPRRSTTSCSSPCTTTTTA